MITVYNGEAPPPSWRRSIFLAGPSPRSPEQYDWRREALDTLQHVINFAGVVFAPLPRHHRVESAVASADGAAVPLFDLDGQVSWETMALEFADCIVFWVPRTLPPAPNALPGFTTNVEFGLYSGTGKCVLGYPAEAEGMRYIHWWATTQFKIPVFADMLATLSYAARVVTKWGGSPVGTTPMEEEAQENQRAPVRSGGCRGIPLWLFTRSDIRAWVSSQEAAGNRIEDAVVRWVLPPRTFSKPAATSLSTASPPVTGVVKPLAVAATPQGDQGHRVPFIVVLHARIWIGAELRYKDNEIVVFRPDVSSVVLFCKPEVTATASPPNCTESSPQCIRQTRLILVGEFRTPVRNLLGLVVEPPGGSSWEQLTDTDQQVNGESEVDRVRRNIDAAKRVAIEELSEEVGLHVSADRVTHLGSRQIASTMCAHHAHVFVAEVTPSEWLTCDSAAKQGTVFGVAEDTERTRIYTCTVGDVIDSLSAGSVTVGPANGLDWSSIGMLLAAVVSQT